ncbi:MAG: peptide chain release factor N(5)-glutamine methyltransferase [Candidatus Gracilibacteria bacterium]
MNDPTLGSFLASTTPSDRLAAELIVGYVLDKSKEWVFSHPEYEFSSQESDRLAHLWSRFGKGESVAYLIGEKEFFGLKFKVDSRVLVPRPETEHLVEAVLARVQDSGLTEPRILDVGTGCGAIALALAHTLPQAQVFASDVSPEAIEVARENAERLGLSKRVSFFISDLLESFPREALRPDVIVANLPYIGTEKFNFVEKSVKKFEPHVALFASSDGLDLYRRLFEQISCSGNAKQVGGKGVKAWCPRWILGEFGSLQKAALEQELRHYFPDPSVQIEFHTDLAGLDRYFIVELPKSPGGSRTDTNEVSVRFPAFHSHDLKKKLGKCGIGHSAALRVGGMCGSTSSPRHKPLNIFIVFLC